ncbi:TRAP transporter large permease [Halomonas sp. BC04]|uniref:TRAP transporter large permease n=1 Tax=Halomonas sp. BC04 TaxID=1403540 RepID=UPI0003ED624E|nr:TRAP transporter large permease [Halomonas sp. BC04]EWG98374.1 hypothetical protein Q427_30900 [Halomonas sp. BC04]
MLIILLGLLLLLILMGFPVLLAIGVIGFGGIIYIPELNPALFPQRMFGMLDSFSLLALPYFILAGELMLRGGMSQKLVEFSDALVGHVRGGLAHANVVSSMAFSGVSGSSTADTSAIGSILIPTMKDRGYKPGFAAAITAVSGTIGPIIPPSMTMIIYGSMAGVSIGSLFLSGILPGLAIAFGLMAVTHVMSYLKGFPELRVVTGKFDLKNVLRATRNVWTALLAPVIILGGILGGVFTATEAGIVATVYALFISMFVYRQVRIRDLPYILFKAGLTTGMVVGIIAAAGSIGYLLSYLDFNQIVGQFVIDVAPSPLAAALIFLGIMIGLTMFVESLAVLVIMVPIAVLIGNAYAFDPIHFGLLVVMATQIGATTPPVAVLLFVATSIAKTSYDQTIKYCWPFVLVLILVLLLVLVVPELATWIPGAVMR